MGQTTRLTITVQKIVLIQEQQRGDIAYYVKSTCVLIRCIQVRRARRDSPCRLKELSEVTFGPLLIIFETHGEQQGA